MVRQIVEAAWGNKLLLVAAVALGVAAMAAFLPGMAEAHHGGGFYWQGWWNWNGQYCQGLFNSSHQLLYYRCS